MNAALVQALLADPAYPRLKEHVIRSTGLAYYADKDGDLASPLARRMAVRGLSGCAAYLKLLTEGSDGVVELDALITDLTIGETFFFRHRELFDALRNLVIPDLIARNGSTRRLRIWCAGCSIGAEPYSLSILLRRELGSAVAGWDVSILGTDINREFLHRAREGRFQEWALRNTTEEVRRTCFVRSGTGWVLAPEYREGVSFQYHNLVVHPFPSLLHDLADFDLILCRNVTIYFSLDIVRDIVERFRQSLVEGGWLAVGHAEPNLELFRAFRTVNTSGAVLYQKASGTKVVACPLTETPALLRFPGQAWTLTPAGPEMPATGPAPAPVRPVEPMLPQPSPAPEPSHALDVIRALADRGAWSQAAKRCEELLARENLNPTVHFYHGLVQEQMGRHAEAERALRRALYLDSGHILAHYYLGLLQQRQGQLAPAVRSFRNGLRLLGSIDPGKVFIEGDGITAGELRKLIEMHLEALEEA